VHRRARGGPQRIDQLIDEEPLVNRAIVDARGARGKKFTR